MRPASSAEKGETAIAAERPVAELVLLEADSGSSPRTAVRQLSIQPGAARSIAAHAEGAPLPTNSLAGLGDAIGQQQGLHSVAPVALVTHRHPRGRATSRTDSLAASGMHTTARSPERARRARSVASRRSVSSAPCADALL